MNQKSSLLFTGFILFITAFILTSFSSEKSDFSAIVAAQVEKIAEGFQFQNS